MKSYFLLDFDVAGAEAALSEALPRYPDNWVLWHKPDEDAVAWFYESTVELSDGDTPAIQVDVSGRHYNEDDRVLTVLRRLQARIGGKIINDDEEPVA